MALCKTLLVAMAVVIIVGALLPVTTSAPAGNVYKVGDDSGWALGVDYNWWSLLKNPFLVGDTLVFVYPQGSHDVVWVTEGNYDACTVPSNAPTLNSGNDRVTFAGPGRFFFICGVEGHCRSGMKLPVTIL